MKKLSLLLAILLLLLSLAGCSSQYEQNVWYTEEKLAECLVPDLPKMEASFLSRSDQYIYTSLAKEEFEAYVQSVYDYLKTQDFAYLGTQGHVKASLAGFLTSYYFQPAETLEQHYKNGDYYFIYSDGATDENGSLIFHCLLIQNSYGSGYSVEYNDKKVYYNTVLTLRKNSESTGRYYYDPEGIDPCFFEHTYNEGTTYPIPGSQQTVTIRTCVNCGHEDYTPFTGDMHSYGLTVTKGGKYILNIPETHGTDGVLPEKHSSGILMKLYTQRLLDADIVFTVNGTVIPKIDTEKGWCYAFIFPNCDAEISIEVTDGFLPPNK